MKKLRIIVPYRDRKEHLDQFLPHMKKALAKEQNFNILIVEQLDARPFNRAKLLNVGYDYSKSDYDYFCFHDVDMLPMLSDYSYCEDPTHLATIVEQFQWALPYQEYFGGVTIFNKESFEKVNGYSNDYHGWGAEDDDIYRRCIGKGIFPRRKQCSFKSLHHERIINESQYQKNVEKLNNFDINNLDGLSSLKYEIKQELIEDYYTIIKVEI